ncbi:hypothetical protein [Clostridium lundense]|uniref:hypothetical protein n=1 Tax=Clostridium lundense TaxID=319475 RepID=UPI0004837FF0|nr:hypothetical protein [Clostridium lundense]
MSIEKTKKELKDICYGILNVIDDIEECKKENDESMVNTLNRIKNDFKIKFQYLSNKYEAEKILNKK